MGFSKKDRIKMVKYEVLRNTKQRLFGMDFSINKINFMMCNLARKITEYEKGRGVTQETEQTYLAYDTRINKIKLKSNDSVVDGEIRYSSPQNVAGVSLPASITADFQFNSNSEKDIEEYKGLAKIIKRELRGPTLSEFVDFCLVPHPGDAF